MSSDKFDPMKEIADMRDSVSKAVNQGLRSLSGSNAPHFPAVDVYETEDAVVVRTEPILGLNIETVEVSMEEDMLSISGEALPEPADVPDESYLQREIRFGEFARQVRIPIPVQADQASAHLKHGVLIITLPKARQEGKGQIISVTPVE